MSHRRIGPPKSFHAHVLPSGARARGDPESLSLGGPLRTSSCLPEATSKRQKTFVSASPTKAGVPKKRVLPLGLKATLLLRTQCSTIRTLADFGTNLRTSLPLVTSYRHSDRQPSRITKDFPSGENNSSSTDGCRTSTFPGRPVPDCQ